MNLLRHIRRLANIECRAEQIAALRHQVRA